MTTILYMFWDGFSAGQEQVDPGTLYGWLEATAVGRLHARLEGRLHTGTEED